MTDSGSSNQALNDASEASDGEIILDVSWLTERAGKAVMTDGISRIEMAWIKLLIGWFSDRVVFSRLNRFGRYGRLSQTAVLNMITQTENVWQKNQAQNFGQSCKQSFYQAKALIELWPHLFKPQNGIRILLQASPHHLDNEAALKNILEKEQASFVCLIYDTDQLDYPEYIKPSEWQNLRKRLDIIARYADCVIADSEATRNRFLPFMAEAGRSIPVVTIPLGADGLPNLKLQNTAPKTGQPPEHPYFLAIESNHSANNTGMLVAVWKRLILQFGEKAPDLLILGHDRKESPKLEEMLARNPDLRRHIRFYESVNDQQLSLMMQQARALLKPAFFARRGMVIAEALRHGLPVIASDIAVYREISSQMADYIDPLNGAAWEEAISEYMNPFSSRRQTQVMRLKGWHPMLWQDHMRKVLAVIAAQS
ncbi:MAG: glycosyltransferase family 1 protein [Zymomonas mobilis]|uniref:Glycosyltransferase involved in cell wall biosynthesis n=1 Tax=Zymomonas mobilis TaxID=542 RepID=A0A542VZU5_ZYMMB|nr:glycosyltransferase family 1 protein [Zymomonas mobilis]TQL16817.1 glycosyltransferase involved in cell wall biosynthesis [Zymomonas mobilis]